MARPYVRQTRPRHHRPAQRTLFETRDEGRSSGLAVALGGSLHSIGWTAGEPAVFPPYSTVGPPKSLTSFLNQGEAGGELATLVQLVAAGRLAVEVGWRGPWERVAEAAEALVGRRVNGKAVLDVRPAAG